MFPFRDHNPSNATPYVTWVLIGANCLIFVSYLGIQSDARALGQFFANWGIIPSEITRGNGFFSLLSSMFIHGGWMHLFGNMLFLWIFGDNLEEALGHGRFLGFYLLCGIAAALLQVVAAPWSNIPVVGASGAIAGVMGGYLLLYPKAKIDVLLVLIIYFRVIPVPAWVMLGIWFGMQLFGGFSSPGDEGGVAYWAHAGGFIAGLGLVVPVWLRTGGVQSWERNHGVPPHPEKIYKFARSNIPRVRRKRPGPGPWA